MTVGAQNMRCLLERPCYAALYCIALMCTLAGHNTILSSGASNSGGCREAVRIVAYGASVHSADAPQAAISGLVLRGGGRERGTGWGEVADALQRTKAAGKVEDDRWDDVALQRCIRDLKENGKLKHFIDGLYLPGVHAAVPHVSCAASPIQPVNRFRTTDEEIDSEDRVNLAHFERVQRAFMRARRGEPLGAESSIGSSVFGSTEWDSEKLEEAFPSDGDQDPLAYKCEYITGPRIFKYLSGRRQDRWHKAANERFKRLQAMDSDEFVDGVDDELKYERDIYKQCVINVNGSRIVVSKAPFHEGEAGYVGKNGELIAGQVVRHTRALTTAEMEHLQVREQERYSELYGKERVEQQQVWTAAVSGVGGEEWEEEVVHVNTSRRGGGNTTRIERRKEPQESDAAAPEEGGDGEAFKLRHKMREFEKADWRDSASASPHEAGSREHRRETRVESGDSDLDLPVILPYTYHTSKPQNAPEIARAGGRREGGGGGSGSGGDVSGGASALFPLLKVPWNDHGLLMTGRGGGGAG